MRHMMWFWQMTPASSHDLWSAAAVTLMRGMEVLCKARTCRHTGALANTQANPEDTGTKIMLTQLKSPGDLLSILQPSDSIIFRGQQHVSWSTPACFYFPGERALSGSWSLVSLSFCLDAVDSGAASLRPWMTPLPSGLKSICCTYFSPSSFLPPYLLHADAIHFAPLFIGTLCSQFFLLPHAPGGCYQTIHSTLCVCGFVVFFPINTSSLFIQWDYCVFCT